MIVGVQLVARHLARAVFSVAAIGVGGERSVRPTCVAHELYAPHFVGTISAMVAERE